MNIINKNISKLSPRKKYNDTKKNSIQEDNEDSAHKWTKKDPPENILKEINKIEEENTHSIKVYKNYEETEFSEYPSFYKHLYDHLN